MLRRFWDKHQREIVVAAVCLAVSILLYAFSLRGAFVRDDYLFKDRPDLYTADSFVSVWFQPYTAKDQSSGVYRPLSLVTFAVTFVTMGDSTIPHHAINVLLNASIVFLVYLITRKLFKDEWLAYLTAAIFAFMPIHTEAVAFIKSRDELMAALFSLLAWLAFMRGVDRSKLDRHQLRWSAWLFILAVLSKETLFSVPAIFFAVWYIKDRPKFKRMWEAAKCYIAPVGVYMVVRILVLGRFAFGSDNAEFYINPLITANHAQRFATACKIAFLIFSKTVYPWQLTSTYNFNHLHVISSVTESPQAIAGLLILLALLAACLTKRVGLLVRVGAITSLVSYFMISKLIFMGGEITAERWMYFPSIGIALIMAGAIKWVIDKQRLVGFVMLASLLGFYGYVTVNRNLAWMSMKTMGDSMLKTAPGSVMTYGTLTDWYFNRDQLDLAKQQIAKSLDIYKDFAVAHEQRGEIAFIEGDYRQAVDSFQKAIELDARVVPPVSRVTLARALLRLYRYKDAITTAQVALTYGYSREAQIVLAASLYKTQGLGAAKQYMSWDDSPQREKIALMERMLSED